MRAHALVTASMLSLALFGCGSIDRPGAHYSSAPVVAGVTPVGCYQGVWEKLEIPVRVFSKEGVLPGVLEIKYLHGSDLSDPDGLQYHDATHDGSSFAFTGSKSHGWLEPLADGNVRLRRKVHKGEWRGFTDVATLGPCPAQTAANE